MKTTLVFGALILALVGFAAPALAADVDPKLNPPGPPAPTMKTLDQIPPTWDQVLPAADRFKLVMGGVAVLDKETGLVWEKSPSTSSMVWANGFLFCWRKTLGFRMGWRLPTVEELASLVDPRFSHPSLASGHPFTNVRLAAYCSATTLATDTSAAWYVEFYTGQVNAYPKTFPVFVWCVRGGRGHDGQ